MTEEEVMNLRGGEISDSNDADQHKIKAEYCNGVAHENGDEVAVENGTIGAAINGDSDVVVAAGNWGDFGASDLDKVEGVAVGESVVAVSGAAEEAECECEAVNNKNENDCEEKTEISNLTISVGGDVQNDEGSVVVADVSEDAKRDVTDVSKIHDREFEAQNGAENETCDSVVVGGVKGADANGINQNGEIHGDEIDDGASGDDVKDDIDLEKEYGADTNGSYSELERQAVENCMVNKESEVSDVKQCADEDGQGNSAEKAQIQSVDSGGEDEKDGKNAVPGTRKFLSDAVSDEKEVVGAVLEVTLTDHKLEYATNGDVQNGSECGEKDDIPVVVDGTATDVDVKECMGEDAKISSDEEKEKVETVSDLDSDRTEVGAEIPIVGEHKIDSSSNEVSEVESRQELLLRGKDSLATNVLGDGNGVSDVKDNAGESEDEPLKVVMESEPEPSKVAMESEPEPSKVAVESEVEPSRVGVESEVVDSEAECLAVAVNSEAETLAVAALSEAEPSTVAIESEAEPSTVVVESEAEPLTVEAESEAEPSAVAAESEAEPSAVAAESEAEPSAVAAESEAEPSAIAAESESKPSTVVVESEAEHSIITVENEAEPSSESKISVECEGGSHRDEEMRPTQEGSSTDALDGQNMGSEVVRRPFYYLIRLPRYDDDENIKNQIKVAFHQVEEKTKIRDAIRAENQAKKGICKEYNQEFRAALSAERASRDLLKSKRQEMDSVQSTINRLNNEISVGDIGDKIRNMEHMIQHETLPLKEEKQLIRQIKQLKQSRDELSSSMGKQDQSKQAPDHKDSIEESFKQLQLLKKEMELLRNSVQKGEAATKAARKKYDDECRKQNEISAQFRAADEVRQEAYVKLQTLKKQLHEKSKYFWEYRDALKKGQELAAEGKKDELQCFCIDQVEKIMEMWNKNDEFRRDYVRCNTRSTLRRLQTLDGRSLGPDEEPPVIPNAITERASTNNSVILQSMPEQEKKSTTATESPDIKDEPVSKAAEKKTGISQTTKAKKPVKPALLEKTVAPISRWGDEPEDTPEEPVRTKEEEEQILKAEKARQEEEVARLKEKRRLEEIEKAKEAMERKKRNAEKAQQRAALKAQKEAEQKEKEREKRLRKKERRKAATTTETAENTEQESTPPLSETVVRSTEECDQSDTQVKIPKKMQKPSQFTKQSKAKSIPLPLRNRGKRQIQPWMWALFAVLAIVGLFFMGNSSSVRSWLQGSGY